MKPLIQVQAVSQRFNTASGEFPGAAECLLRYRRRGDHQSDRPLGLRKIDPAESDRRDHDAHRGRTAV